MEDFIKAQNEKVNQANQDEFSGASSEGDTSARTNPSQLTRENHMKTAVIDNQDRLLSRTILVEPPKEKVFYAAEERVRNLETHLGIVTGACDKNLFERIKIVEDKILKIEQLFPQIAAHCFNYGRAEKEASLRPGARVSRIEKDVKLEKKRFSDPQSVHEIQSKLLKLREKISSNKK